MPYDQFSEYADYTSESAKLFVTTFVDSEEIELSDSPDHVVTTLHGIRDHGIWSLDLQYISRKYGLNVLPQPVSYPRVGVLTFLFGRNSEKVESKIRDEFISIIERYPNSAHSIIAHSNGTKLASKIIKSINHKYHGVYFCGSVCMRDEVPLSPGTAKRVVNDCSPVDIWPVLAEAIRPKKYQASGTYGFRRSGVEDRYFSVKHGGCLTADHFLKYIVPMIVTDNKLVFGERPCSTIPYWVPKFLRIFIVTIISLLLCVFGTLLIGI